MAEQIRTPNPISNQKIWDMVKVIVDKQKAAKDLPTENVDWNSLEGDWFDWIEEILFKDGEVIQKPLKSKSVSLDFKDKICNGCSNYTMQCTCFESSKNDFLNTIK
jgi:hypothetical protein